MATRQDFQQVVQAKRKMTWMEIVGNIIIWASPVLIVLFVLIWNWGKLWQQKTTFHIELWAVIVLFVSMLVYIKWGKKKIREQYIADKSRAEKHSPLLVIGNTFICIMPFVLGILACDILSSLGEPLTTFLIVLVCFQVLGRTFLIIDSFKDEEYK